MQKEDSGTISMEMLLKKYKDRKIAKNEVSFFLLEQYYSSDSD